MSCSGRCAIANSNKRGRDSAKGDCMQLNSLDDVCGRLDVITETRESLSRSRSEVVELLQRCGDVAVPRELENEKREIVSVLRWLIERIDNGEVAV